VRPRLRGQFDPAGEGLTSAAPLDRAAPWDAFHSSRASRAEPTTPATGTPAIRTCCTGPTATEAPSPAAPPGVRKHPISATERARRQPRTSGLLTRPRHRNVHFRHPARHRQRSIRPGLAPLKVSGWWSRS